jgi:hypothetical protein
MEPAVFAARAKVVFAPLAPPDEVRAQVEAFLHELGDALTAAGCTLVGHVKGTLDGAALGRLSFSMTSLRQDGRVSATLTDKLGAAELTLNVIVFGIPDTALFGIVTRAWESCVPAATIWRL